MHCSSKFTPIVKSACMTRTKFGADWVDKSVSSAASSPSFFLCCFAVEREWEPATVARARLAYRTARRRGHLGLALKGEVCSHTRHCEYGAWNISEAIHSLFLDRIVEQVMSRCAGLLSCVPFGITQSPTRIHIQRYNEATLAFGRNIIFRGIASACVATHAHA
jgi:hypothetical protein